MDLNTVAGIVAGTIGVLLMFKLQDMLKFRDTQVFRMADKTVEAHKKQIRLGEDFEGKKFKPYSKSYAKRKGVHVNNVNLTLTGKMLDNFKRVRVNVKKNQEIQFLYGIKKNKQGTKLFLHNEGEGNMPKRSIAEDQELGEEVEDTIVKQFAISIGENLSRMSKTHVKVNI
jgi:hypothetical protein